MEPRLHCGQSHYFIYLTTFLSCEKKREIGPILIKGKEVDQSINFIYKNKDIVIQRDRIYVIFVGQV